MNKKPLGLALLILGAVVLVISLVANAIGAAVAVAGIGYKQLAGAGVGVVIAFIGLWLSRAAATARP